MLTKTAINFVNCVSIPATLIAGLLIAGVNPKRKLIGACFYAVSNICMLLMFFITRAESFLVTFFVFSSLTITNIIQILNQMRKK